MRKDEIIVDISHVKSLLKNQFPTWSNLPLKKIPSFGTDNILYHLGEDLLILLPEIYWADGQVEKELYWLSKLAPYLPLTVSHPIALGQP